ncbi:MAG TPA: SRPBCC family protein [Candidatus Acidoferrales bacterium]|nr:SRPBCC family protein [Candidatus Acidoferrales bacterium]
MIHIHAEVDIDRPVEEVFAYFQDPDNRLQWQTWLVQHEHEPLDIGANVSEVRNVLGKRVELRGEIVEFEKDRLIGFRGRGPLVNSVGYQQRFERLGAARTRVFAEVSFEPNQSLAVARQLIESIVTREVENSMQHLKDILEHQDQASHLHAALPRHHHHAAPMVPGGAADHRSK